MNKMLRFQIKVENVFDYLFNPFISKLNSTEQVISGWIKEENVSLLKENFVGYEIKLIDSVEYEANYFHYSVGKCFSF